MSEDIVEKGDVIVDVRRDSRDAALSELVPKVRGSITWREMRSLKGPWIPLELCSPSRLGIQ